MERLTRPVDGWPCRTRKCKVQEWFEELFGDGEDYLEQACDNCPFEEVYERLGMYEDVLEGMPGWNLFEKKGESDK